MASTSDRHALRLCVCRCPHGTYAISLDYGDRGTRLTGAKCCGRWTVEREFVVTARTMREAAEEAEAHEELQEKAHG